VSRHIILDSGPLGLLMQRQGVPPADACRHWLLRHIQDGAVVLVPEIADYEVRRELLRLNAIAAVERLDRFITAAPNRLIPMTSNAFRLGASLWAQLRKDGLPTADPHALDADVLIVAQVLTAGLAANEFVIASTNVSHIARLAPSEIWQNV